MESAFNGNVPNIGGGNQFLVIGFTSYDKSRQGPVYGVQLVIAFGSNKIAIRYAAYNSLIWSAWRII
jgi:hypothetical protein